MFTTLAIVVAVFLLGVAVLLRLKQASPAKDAESESVFDMPKDTQQLIERARVLQQKYRTPNSEEKKRLLARGISNLAWDETLRFLHLVCLDIVSGGPGKDQLHGSGTIEDADTPIPPGENRDLLVELVAHLSSQASPYKPRPACVWHGSAGESAEREPDLVGIFRNASLTHLGCIEVIRLDSQQKPTELAFIPLDDLGSAVFASSALFRFGRFFFDDGRPDEIVLAPLLYGISWFSPNDFDRDGTMTRFICFLEMERGQPDLGVGVGHQDFLMEDGSGTLFGLSSISQLEIPLSLDDPKFDQKCHARGLDPEDVRKSMSKE